MRRRNWSHILPASCRHGMPLCKEHAQEKLNLSVERLGLKDHRIICKWVENGHMLSSLIPAYQSGCGINHASRWLASSSGHLPIPIPTGKKTTGGDMQVLQEALNVGAADVLAAIRNGMEGLVWNRENLKKHATPELDFGGFE